MFSSENELIPTSKIGNPWLYQSKRYEKELDILFFGNRYYDPKMGRWITPDPVGFVDGLNLYAYALNDPSHLIDLYGFATESSPNFGAYQPYWEQFRGKLSFPPTESLGRFQSLGRSFLNTFNSPTAQECKGLFKL